MSKKPSISTYGFRWGIIRDPIYDYIPFNKDVEGKIIDTPYVQRLRRIHQLQIAHFIYPGADHKRFQHSLGVMHLTGMFSEHLLTMLTTAEGEELLEGYNILELVEASRIAGLLHDIGHGPYSHSFEESILSKSKKLREEGLGDHELVGLALIECTSLGDMIDKIGKEFKLENLKELVLKLIKPYDPAAPTIIRLLQKVVKNWIYPADIMDFLIRDSYYAGTKEYGTIDYYRLIFYSYPYKDLIVMDEKNVNTLRSFLQSRQYMFDTVYLHPICRSFEHTIQLMLKNVREELELENRVLEIKEGKPERYLELDDYSILYMIISLSENKENVKLAKEYTKDLLYRRKRWKPVGKPYDISLPTHEAPFFYRFGDPASASKEIFEVLSEKLEDAGFKEYVNLFWVDHSMRRSLPALPYPLHIVHLARRVKDKIEIVDGVPISKILEEAGLKPKITFTIYGPTVLLKDYSVRKKLETIASEVFKEVFGTTPGVTM
ncbi:MAG: hypothetical protein DRO23_01035 [Thermoprotei archaeon]|nr:MAG: hypothetical protein DRO23_01035 [Thermoprotei archaeon]